MRKIAGGRYAWGFRFSLLACTGAHLRDEFGLVYMITSRDFSLSSTSVRTSQNLVETLEAFLFAPIRALPSRFCIPASGRPIRALAASSRAYRARSSHLYARACFVDQPSRCSKTSL
jgi:hypothetical protein